MVLIPVPVPKRFAEGNVSIARGYPYSKYSFDPGFSAKESDFAGFLAKVFSRTADISGYAGMQLSKQQSEKLKRVVQQVEAANAVESLVPEEELSTARQMLADFLREFAFVKDPDFFAANVFGLSLGLGKISVFMSDPMIEEIMVNGFSRNVFIFHKQYGMCTSDISFSQSELFSLIRRISVSAGKQFDEANPLLDARLPDGSRANATFSQVSPAGHSLTVRKFSFIPLSVVDLVKSNTVSAEAAAFIWALAEGLSIEPMNILVTGGASSGKTTLLNVMASFIRLNDRIISIEDTLEISLGERDNWVQLEARPAIGKTPGVSMDDLLKNSLRMRPDRLIVGEVRGEEAQTLFVAMDTGHKGILGTVHSNSAKEMMLRLKSPPMNVPAAMLPLLDLAIVTEKFFNPKVGVIRRVKAISEISRMQDQVLLSNVFEYDRKSDALERTDVPSRMVEVLAEKTFKSKNEVKQEMLVRQKIIEWLIETGVADYYAVQRFIQQYYTEPEEILKKVFEHIRQS
ncbi:MAG: CpaF family protein [Candidatus Diapherotrites archaeon]|nr:CpaF family protein [Candidatus Diapherotrites archaeon]